jgi:hypothetical protein
VNDAAGVDQVVFGSGIATTAVTTTRDATDLFLNVNVTGNTGKVTVQNYFAGQEAEQIKFSDGTIWDVATVRAKVLAASQTAAGDTIYGYETNDTINSLAGADTVYGGAGNDTIDGGAGADTLYGEDGDDVISAGTGDANNATVVNLLYGGNGNDVLNASGKSDQLFGQAGNDILRGGAGVNLLEESAGSNAMDALAGNDTLRGGGGNDAFIGGAGNDAIDGDFYGTGLRGQDIVLFNKGAGTDTVTRIGSGSTLSMGGGMLYKNLVFSVSGNTLTVNAGQGTVSFTDWYSGNKAVSKLQIVIEGSRDYSATSTNPMNNKKIQTFDFLGLVNAFDAARAAGQTFNVASNLPTYRLSGSDTDAIGGAIAYQYNRNGAISSITNPQLQAILASANFGVNPQPISATAPQSLEAAPASTESAPLSFSAQADSIPVTQLSTDPAPMPESPPDSPAADGYDPVAAELAQAPQYDFAALFDSLGNQGGSGETLEPAEIARRWARVASYVLERGQGASDDARAAAFGWQRFADAFAAANAGGTASLAQFTGLGAASGLPGLDSFKGLNEGFAKL